MSVSNTKQLQEYLKVLARTSLDAQNRQISFLTPIGEVLTLQMSTNVLIRFTQDRIIDNLPEKQIFWRYSNDAYVDVTLAMPDFIIKDIADELDRLDEIIVEVIE